MDPSPIREDVPGFDDPEYLASVFEWDAADIPTVVRPRPPECAPAARREIVAVLGVLGVLGAIVFATWGIRQLRATT
jgi:hypothetical protein